MRAPLILVSLFVTLLLQSGAGVIYASTEIGGAKANINVINTYDIRTITVSRIGGREVNVHGAGVTGSFEDSIITGQLLVTSILPEPASAKPPIIMMPPWGFPADGYLTTLDGREGWALNFVRAGHPVYLVDPANTMRSGFNPAPFNASRESAPETERFFYWGKKHVWTRFGLGPEYGKTFADGRFPADRYDDFVASFVHVAVSEANGETMIEHTIDANISGITKLLTQTGPAVLLVNSGSGPTGFGLAQRLPEQVKAVINFEPVGCPVKNLQGLATVPVLSVFADHMEVRPQMPIRKDECQILVDTLEKSGVYAKMLDLPAMGIKGNSHMAATENNSAEIAVLMIDWLSGLEE